MKPIAWYDPTNGMVSTDKDSSLFTPLGQVLPLYPQSEQEPVAWISAAELVIMRGNALGGAKDWRVNLGLKPEDGDVGLYTTPPQRKPLTDEEIATIAKEHIAVGTRSFEEFARRIEAAHGIKGEA